MGYSGGSGKGGLSDLHTDKYARLNLRYPMDIEGPEEGHFVRFTVHSISGAKLESAPRNSPEQNTEGGFLADIAKEIKESDVGTDISEGFSSAFNAVGGAVNKVTSGIESVVGSVGGAIDGLTSAAGLGNLGTPLVSGAVGAGASQLGGVVNMPGSIGAITSALSGLLGFKRKSLGHIVLYMPHGINESYRPQWTAQEIGLVGALGLQAWRGSQAGKGGWELLGQALATGKEGAMAVGLQKAAGIVGQESLVNLVLREEGKKAINPHMEQFFTGVDFRNFSFTFKFSPRSQKEAIQVQAIIRAFKFYSAPAHYGKGKYGAFWQYPNEFGIEYWNADKLHKVKKCACTGVEVNYSGSGTNATFYDGHPVETDLTLNFIELTQMTKSDFRQADGSKYGY
jgi:hypothetical protein